MTDDGALSLSIALQANTYLNSLSLPKNQLTTFGLENLLDCLDVNPNITELDIHENLITAIPTSLQQYLKGVSTICPLQVLNLSSNPLSSQAIIQLFQCLHVNTSLLSL